MVLNAVNETQIELLVGGVVKKFPINNSFNFSALLRFENFTDINKIKLDDWSDWRNPSTFVEVTSPKVAGQISTQLKKVHSYKKSSAYRCRGRIVHIGTI